MPQVGLRPPRGLVAGLSGGTTGGLGALGQLVAGAGTEAGATPRLFDNPIGGVRANISGADRQMLQALQAALGQGLDPGSAMGMVQSVISNAQARITGRQEHRQGVRAENAYDQQIAALPPEAQQAAQLAQFGVPAGVIEGIYASGTAGSPPGGMSPETVEAVLDHTRQLIADGTVPLHNARMLILGGMRADPTTTDQELQEAYDLIGQQYAAAPASSVADPTTGQNLIGGRPLTYAGRLQELQQPAAPPPAPAPQSLVDPRLFDFSGWFG